MSYYNAYSAAMERRFGKKVYKLAVDAGMSCPNRDGTIDSRGCSFCLNGSGDFARHGTDINAQLDSAKALVSDKYSGNSYIAYFQSYTNTYAPLSRLRELYDSVALRDDIVGIAIATRPDCLPQEVVDYLAELSRKKAVWVELGLQTIHESTAEAIRRGYKLPVFDDAMARLRAAGLETVVHVILGLPGETREMMLRTVNYVAHSGADGIKLQLLHVLEGTDIAEDYKAGKFRVMDMDEYVFLLEDCIRLLPKDMVVHRLTGDGSKKSLIAPMWSANKKRVLNAITTAFKRDNVIQGEKYE